VVRLRSVNRGYVVTPPDISRSNDVTITAPTADYDGHRSLKENACNLRCRRASGDFGGSVQVRAGSIAALHVSQGVDFNYIQRRRRSGRFPRQTPLLTIERPGW